MTNAGSPRRLAALDPVGRRVIEVIRARLMIDDTWTEWHSDGFTWWAHRLAQRFRVEGPVELDGLPTWWASFETDLFRGVPTEGPAAGLMAFAANRTTNLFTSFEVGGRLRHRARVYLLPETLDHRAEMLADRALFSNVLAHEAARVIEGGPAADATFERVRIDARGHPRAGSRLEPDEMLGIVEQVFRPMGRDALAPSRAPDLAAARAALPTDVAAGASVGASGDDASEGDASEGDASVPDRLTATFEIGGVPIALILAANIEQPFLGWGLLSLLHLRPQVAKTVSDRRPIDLARSLADRLNHAEGSVREPLLGVGGWVPHSDAKDPTGLAYASFHPNATMVRELPFVLAADAVRRARWAVGELDLAQSWAA